MLLKKAESYDKYKLAFLVIYDKLQMSCILLNVTYYMFQDPVTKDNLGNVVYYPSNGFKFRYFPNTGLEGWQSPLVFVRLDEPNPAISLRVTCSAYAKNMKHDDILHTGKVSFDVMVD
jgi:sodium/potassium-transporting ATPase subunit beta